MVEQEGGFWRILLHIAAVETAMSSSGCQDMLHLSPAQLVVTHCLGSGFPSSIAVKQSPLHKNDADSPGQQNPCLGTNGNGFGSCFLPFLHFGQHPSRPAVLILV